MNQVVVTTDKVEVSIFDETRSSTVVTYAGTTEAVSVLSEGPQGPIGTAGAPGPPKALTIAPPKAGDEFTLFYTQHATSLTQVLAVVRGTDPGVEFELRYGPDRSTAGTLAIIPESVTNTTTGETATIQNMPIPPNNFVWLKVTAVTGIVQEFNVSVEV